MKSLRWFKGRGQAKVACFSQKPSCYHFVLGENVILKLFAFNNLWMSGGEAKSLIAKRKRAWRVLRISQSALMVLQYSFLQQKLLPSSLQWHCAAGGVVPNFNILFSYLHLPISHQDWDDVAKQGEMGEGWTSVALNGYSEGIRKKCSDVIWTVGLSLVRKRFYTQTNILSHYVENWMTCSAVCLSLKS